MSFLISANSAMSPSSSVALLMTVWAAASFDWTSWRIPNALLAGSAAAALMLSQFAQNAPGTLYCLLGGVAGLAILIPFYLKGGMGAGDVKLLAVVGMHTGWMNVIDIAVASAIVGGVWSVALLVFRLRSSECSQLPNATRRGRMPLMAANSRGTVPYGVVIAIGTTAVLAAMKATGG